MGQDIVRNRLIGTAVAAQLRNPIRIGQESHVKHKVCIARRAIFEAKGLDGDVLDVFAHITEGGLHRPPQIMDGEVGGIDDDVSTLAGMRDGFSLPLNACLQRVAAL